VTRVITLTTDFGEGSPYVAQMKGVILSLNPQANVVDLSHAVDPQDIRMGARVLDDCCWRFPCGTVHVAVVDPGVGTARAIVAACAGRHWFVAPDNGLLTLVFRRERPSEQVRLTQREYWLEDPSSTFHGRDVMAPVAAHLTLGVTLSQLGEPLRHLAEIDCPAPCVEPGRVTGQVAMIDSFGNVITNIDRSCLPTEQAGGRLRVSWRDQRIDGLVPTYAARAPGAIVAIVGSNARLELAVVNGNAARQLQLTVGDEIVVQWS